jgi:hypothetical protein
MMRSPAVMKILVTTVAVCLLATVIVRLGPLESGSVAEWLAVAMVWLAGLGFVIARGKHGGRV